MTIHTNLPPHAEKAAHLLAHVLGSPEIAGEIGPALTCQEADSVATALALLGRVDDATTWLAWHAVGTEEPAVDLHRGWPYPEAADGYSAASASAYVNALVRREAVTACSDCGAAPESPCAWECSTRASATATDAVDGKA